MKTGVWLLTALMLPISGIVYAGEFETGIYESVPEDSVQKSTRYQAPVVTASSPPAVADTEIPPPLDQLGTISIRCDADGARVVINGKYLGTTPFVRQGFRPGLYQVEVSKSGYQSFSRMVRAAQNDTAYIDCHLSPVSPSVQEFGAATSNNLSAGRQAEPPKGNGTLLVTCSAESASVVVNKSKLGITPFSRTGFLAGYYEVEVKKGGYEPFSTTVQIGADDTARISATLVSLFGRCKISSTPSGAGVLFDGVQRGTTPFDSAEMRPGLYQVRIELPRYVPWAGQLTVVKNRTDSAGVQLMSIAERDSIRKQNLLRFKISRRVIFGTGTLGLLVAGFYYNSKVSQQLELEKPAWDAYEQPDLTAQEYSARYASYSTIKEQTDSFMRKRNACYIVSAVFAAGLAISIPF
jgi:hypothetical protein